MGADLLQPQGCLHIPFTFFLSLSSLAGGQKADVYLLLWLLSFDILVTQAPSFVYEKVEVIFRMDFGKLSEW